MRDIRIWKVKKIFNRVEGEGNNEKGALNKSIEMVSLIMGCITN